MSEWKYANEKRRYALKTRYGMTQEDWDSLIARQQGNCYLCLKPLGRDMVVDHDHSCAHATGSTCASCRRGLAHASCNSAIGYAGDDPDLLDAIARNLRARIEEMRK